MSYAKEILGGSWFGVSLPEWLRAFDCRRESVELFQRAPWGGVIVGNECAAVDLGFRNGSWDTDYDTTPISCSGIADTRTAERWQLANEVADMIKAATKLHVSFLAAKANPAPEGVFLASQGNQGGSCEYQPIAICLCNFGWSVLSDKRTMAIRADS